MPDFKNYVYVLFIYIFLLVMFYTVKTIHGQFTLISNCAIINVDFQNISHCKYLKCLVLIYTEIQKYNETTLRISKTFVIHPSFLALCLC